uniref:Uncharacterized protein n=1 Tax=Fagus sylvatica TaxID=28930 RepID=A0A2N9FXH0_FAGSY
MVNVTTSASSCGWWMFLALSSLNEITWSSIFKLFRDLESDQDVMWPAERKLSWTTGKTVFGGVTVVSVEATVEDLVDGHVQGREAAGSFFTSVGRACVLPLGLWIVLPGRLIPGRIESSIFWFFPLSAEELVSGLECILRIYELLGLVHQF